MQISSRAGRYFFLHVLNEFCVSILKKVLIIEPAGGLWGSERALLDLLASAPSLEFAVCSPPDVPLIQELAERRILTFPWLVSDLHRRSRWHRLRAALGILRACHAFHPDIIHLNQSGAYRITRPAAKVIRRSITAHVRIFEDAAYLASCKPQSELLKAIIAISPSIGDEIRSFGALDGMEVHQIYDAYSLTESSKGRPVPSRIACVGRVTPVKGQDLLLKSVARLSTSFPDIECLIVGDGETNYVNQLKSASPSEVIWTGFIQNVLPLLRTCTLLVCPSYREPLGRVIFEAWDAGAVPIVFSGAGGAPEIVSAARGGVIYEEQSAECLASALSSTLALDPSEIAHFIANGRAWLRANVRPDLYGTAITSILTAAAQH